MPHMLCYKLIPVTGSVVCHGLQETTYRLLVEWRDTPVLRDQLLFLRSKHLTKRCGTPASQHERRIYTTFFKRRHIAKIDRVRSQLIVFLSPPTHPKKPPKLCLS